MAKLLPCLCGVKPRIITVREDRDLDEIVAFHVWCGTHGCPNCLGPKINFETKPELEDQWNNVYRHKGEIQ